MRKNRRNSAIFLFVYSVSEHLACTQEPLLFNLSTSFSAASHEYWNVYIVFSGIFALITSSICSFCATVKWFFQSPMIPANEIKRVCMQITTNNTCDRSNVKSNNICERSNVKSNNICDRPNVKSNNCTVYE